MTEKVIQPKTNPGFANLVYTPDLVPATVNNLTYLKDDSEVTTPSTYGVKAVGTMTFSDEPHEDETFAIDTQTFIWKTSRSTTGEIDRLGNYTENCMIAIGLDLSSVVASGTGTKGAPITITASVAGVEGNETVFTENCAHMTMDGSGHLGGTVAGADDYELLESIAIPGQGYPAILTFSDIASYVYAISGGEFANIKYKVQLYNDTDDVTVEEVTLMPFSVGTLTWNYQPYVRTIVELEDAHDYIWRVYWRKSRSGTATIVGTSGNRILTVQEIKR